LKLRGVRQIRGQDFDGNPVRLAELRSQGRHSLRRASDEDQVVTPRGEAARINSADAAGRASNDCSGHGILLG